MRASSTRNQCLFFLLSVWTWFSAGCETGSREGRHPDAGPDDTSVDAGPESGVDGGEHQSSDSPCAHDASECLWQCDMVLQDCPAGQKCNAVMSHVQEPWEGTACVDDNSENGGRLGDICLNAPGGDDTCGPATMCMQTGTGEGDCREFCRSTDMGPVCSRGYHCAGLAESGRYRLCLARCHPLLEDCPHGENLYGCSLTEGAFACIPWRLHGSGSYLDECEHNLDCGPGHFCASAEQVPGCGSPACCCSTFCDTGGINTCPGAADGQDCVPFYGPGQAPVGYDNVGVCIVDI